ncbi:mannose-6-phosphate isomerase [Spirochaetia bacterium]|nr:mannose-6-phosphate isomerase [Spirochaetia bacterium]
MRDMFNQPWRLVPNKVRGKGGREIDKFRGISPAADDDNGSEAWIGSVTRVGQPPEDNPHLGCAETILPDGRRMYLFEAIALDPRAVLGETHYKRHGENLGMLIKYLDAQAQYILQAHPTRPWAKKAFNSNFGKEESWYVIGTRDDTAEPAYILLGFKEGVTRQDLEKLYRAEDMGAMEKLCHKIPVRVGETYFVGGGLPHALGEGCFVIEVQEPSDITVVPIKQKVMADDTVYDERMLGTFVYDGCGYEENLRRWRIPPKTIREGDWGREYYLIGPDQTSFFSFSRADVQGKAEIRSTGFPQTAIVIEGTGKILFEGGEIPVKKGDEIFLPYRIPGAALEGHVSVIFCHPEGAQ